MVFEIFDIVLKRTYQSGICVYHWLNSRSSSIGLNVVNVENTIIMYDTILSISRLKCFKTMTCRVNQSIKTRDAQASLGYPDRCLRCDCHPSTPVLSSATRSNDDQPNDWQSVNVNFKLNDVAFRVNPPLGGLLVFCPLSFLMLGKRLTNIAQLGPWPGAVTKKKIDQMFVSWMRIKETTSGGIILMWLSVQWRSDSERH